MINRITPPSLAAKMIALITLAAGSGGCLPAAPDPAAAAPQVQQTLQAQPGEASATAAVPIETTAPTVHAASYEDILTVTISPGHGYRFPEKQFTEEGEYYETYWNLNLLMFNGVVIPLGEIADITTVTEISLSDGIIDGYYALPRNGSVYVLAISVRAETQYVLLRLLTVADGGDLTIEYIYPFEGQVK